MLPAMEIDVLDELIGGQTNRHIFATTVGNSYILKLAKLGITKVMCADCSLSPLLLCTIENKQYS